MNILSSKELLSWIHKLATLAVILIIVFFAASYFAGDVLMSVLLSTLGFFAAFLCDGRWQAFRVIMTMILALLVSEAIVSYLTPVPFRVLIGRDFVVLGIGVMGGLICGLISRSWSKKHSDNAVST